MKRLVLLSIFFPTYVFATDVPMSALTVQETAACQKTVNEKWKVGETRYPRQSYSGPVDVAVLFGIQSSSVGIWDPSGVLDRKGAFQWRSNGKPFDVTQVLVWQLTDGITVRQNAKPGEKVQIVYAVNLKQAISRAGKDIEISWTDPTNYKFANQGISATWASSPQNFVDCINIEIIGD